MYESNGSALLSPLIRGHKKECSGVVENKINICARNWRERRDSLEDTGDIQLAREESGKER